MNRIVENNATKWGKEIPEIIERHERRKIFGMGICVVADGHNPTPVEEWGVQGEPTHAIQGVICALTNRRKCEVCPNRVC